MSENGPREGTRDLPRRDPEAGRRSVDPESLSGRAYGSQARQQRRRGKEIRELLDQGLSAAEVARHYATDHPMEYPVTDEEVAAARKRRDTDGARASVDHR